MPVIVGNDLVFSYLAVYARWVVGAVLLLAGTIKAQDMGEFVITIQSFRVLPKQLSQMAGSLIMGLELILGASLLVGAGVRLTALTGVLLFGCFTVVILVNLVRHNILDCNCFGPYFKEKISAKASHLTLWILDADERRFTQVFGTDSRSLSPFLSAFSVFLRPILKLSGG